MLINITAIQFNIRAALQDTKKNCIFEAIEH